MVTVKRSQSIKYFLEHNTRADLAELYNYEMECQVNVAQDGGERVNRDFHGRTFNSYTDGIQTWAQFRIPKNANTEPEDNDIDITFDLSAHVEGIGMTGWNWKQKKSIYVAYDFDAILGHSEKHKKKLTEEELETIKVAVNQIPWITLRRSTGGKGLHIYVFLSPVETKNHTEHIALARAILSQMSVRADYDFNSKVDTNGGIMWVYHRKMIGTNGLELLKAGTKLTDIPPNWLEHVKVIQGRRKKILPTQIVDSKTEELFEELCGQRPRIKLDNDHKRLIDFLRESTPGGSWWDSDHWMLVTHTALLKGAHEKLKLKGPFKTLATGRDYGNDWNCFAYPNKNGAWSVRRYTLGVEEANTWQQDGQTWTKCVLNKVPDLTTACRTYKGIERPAGGFVFKTLNEALEATTSLETRLGTIPVWLTQRRTTLKKHKDGRLIIEIEKKEDDPTDEMINNDWLIEGKFWKKITDKKVNEPAGTELPNYDDLVRHVVTEAGDNYGWLVKSDNFWRNEPLEHVKSLLKGPLGYKGQEVDVVIGSAVTQPWTLVNRPFQDEYPKERQWNRNAAQLKFIPSQDLDNLKYPTWEKILNHLGRNLDFAIKANGWAKANGIVSGADYLKLWIASLFQQPLEQLPYLFFWSENTNTGKTSFHEALGLLITTGVVRADQALAPNNTFNGELENCVLAIVEETDLNKGRTGSAISYNRIKDWVTTKNLPIHRKQKTPYSVPNSSHWVQTANKRAACPIFAGDSRIVVISVEDIEPGNMIPRKDLYPMLEKEAPDFLAEILRIDIPPSNDRLNIPVIMTEDKQIAEEESLNLLELFIKENLYYVPGEIILYKDFYELFKEKVEPDELNQWSKIYVGRHLPSQFPKGRLRNDPNYFIGNISKHPISPDQPKKQRLVSQNGVLISIIPPANGKVEIS